MVDSGNEFKGRVAKLMDRYKVKIQKGEPGNHRSQVFAERANRTIAERLFSHQTAQEMLTDDPSRVWVKRLPAVMRALNSTLTRLTGLKPRTAIEKDKGPIKKVHYVLLDLLKKSYHLM